jgi:hypothetical protein
MANKILFRMGLPGASIGFEALASHNGRLIRVASKTPRPTIIMFPLQYGKAIFSARLRLADRNGRADCPRAAFLLLIMCRVRKINVFDRRMVGLELWKRGNQ